MTNGDSIFYVGTLFALIYLYSITRDRWRWGQIVAWSVIPLVFIVTGLAYLGVWLIGENYHYWGHYLVLALGAAGVIFQLWRLTRSKWNWLEIRNNTLKISGALFFLVGGYYCVFRAT